MEIETREMEAGIEITVRAERDVAVSVRSGQEETIYLPSDGSDSTYYLEGSAVEETEAGFRVYHRGEADSVELLG